MGSCTLTNKWCFNSSHLFFFFVVLKNFNLYLFFFPIIVISWTLIALQYCSGFRHTLTWISSGFTCVPHPEPPQLASWKKSYDKPRWHIKKSRDISLSPKVRIVKAMVFPVVMYGCESWTINKAEELMLSNCGVGEESWESLGVQTGQS